MSLVARMVLASFCVLLAQNSFSRTNNIPYKKTGWNAWQGTHRYLSDAAADCSSRANATSCNGTYIGGWGATTMTGGVESPCPLGGDCFRLHYACEQHWCLNGMDTGVHVDNWYEYYYEPDLPPDQSDTQCQKVPRKSASIVDTAQRTLGEVMPIVGADFDLRYTTYFQSGYKEPYKISVSLPDENSAVYPSARIDIYDDVGALYDTGTYSRPFSVANHVKVWDGNDGSGVLMIGSRKFTVKVYEIDTLSNAVLENQYDVYPGAFKAVKIGIGAWTPSIFAYYEPNQKKAYFGDGTSRSVDVSLVSSKYSFPSEDGKFYYVFDSSGLIEKIQSGLTGSDLYTFAYSSGLLGTITDAYGRVTTFNRSFGAFTGITSNYGATTSICVESGTACVSGSASSNAIGRIRTFQTPAGNLYTLDYGVNRMLSSFGKPNGATSTFTYVGSGASQNAGMLNTDTHSGGYVWTLANITAGVNPDTRKTKVMSTSSVAEYEISKPGQRTTTRSDGTSRQFTYSSSGATVVDRGVTETFTFGSDARHGALVPVTTYHTGHISGANPSTSYSSAVYPASIPDPFTFTTLTNTATLNSKSTTDVFDTTTMTWTTTTPEGRTSTAKIDTYERLLEVQQGALTKEEYTYSGEHLTKVKQGVRETNYAYNGTTGLLDTMTNALSEVTTFGYNSDHQVTSITLPDSRVIGFGYDSVGKVTSVVTPATITHSLNFNSQELLQDYTPPALVGVPVVKTDYTYNTDKQLDLVTRPDGSTIDYTYNATTGKLDTIVTPAGTTNFAYDATTGLVNDVTTPNDVQVVRTYSGVLLNQESIKKFSNGTTISTFSRTYDSEGRIDTDTVTCGPATSTISYGYDQDNLLTAAGALTITYNTDGQVSGTTLGATTDSYTYNSFGEVVSYDAQVSGTTVYSYTLVRDDLGRITSNTELWNGVTTVYDYLYDSTGRLYEVKENSVTTESYVFDNNGNRTSATMLGGTETTTYDNQDRMIADTTYDYSYNANGELVSKYYTGTSSGEDYSYDAFGNLIGYQGSGNSFAYTYDGFGRLVSDKNVSSGLSRRFMVDPENRLIAYSTTGTSLTKRYVWGAKSNVPEYYTSPSGTFRIFSDYRGTPRVTYNVLGGAAVGRASYGTSFGVLPFDTTGLSFGFAGGRTAFSYTVPVVLFGARTYQPWHGKWLQKDPIRFGGGDTNLYGYVMNDPVNFVDPSGLLFEDTIADHTTPEQQAALGTAMVGTGIALIGGSKNPAGMVAGGVMCYEGAKNIQKAKNRVMPDASVSEVIRRLIDLNSR